jgi:hypothetical protein
MQRAVGRGLAIGIFTLSVLAGCGSPPAAQHPAADSDVAPGPGESKLQPQPIPADLQPKVAAAEAIGRDLYVLDQVAAIGTDVMLANVPDPKSKGLGGYLPLQEADEAGNPKESFLVSFFTVEKPPRIACEVRIAKGARPAFQAIEPAKPASPQFAELVRARQAAIDALPDVRQPMNSVLLPGNDGGKSGTVVYLLAGTTRPKVAVFGQHFRAFVPWGTGRVARMEALSKSILELPMTTPEGQQVEALVVTHLVTDYPLETHVFTSLLHHLPVYVGTSRGVWLVEGDKITFLGQQQPAER